MQNLGFPHAYVLGLALVCAVTDLRTGRIYNAVTVPSAAVGVVYSALTGDRGVIAASLAGLFLGLVPFAWAASRGWIGGGDVKLFAAIGAIGGFLFLMDCLLVAFTLGAAYGLARLLREGGGSGSLRGFRELWRARARSTAAGGGPSPPIRTIRMGVFVFLGALATVMWVSTTPAP